MRDLKEKHHINKSIEEFLDIKEEISKFMKPDTEIKDIIDVYQYPFPLIKEILKDLNEDLDSEDEEAIEIRRKIRTYEKQEC